MKRQRGIVLLITLVILVVMTLGAIAMIRALDSSVLIAGNLGFRQAAVHAGDYGIEKAAAWLQSKGTNLLNADISEADGTGATKGFYKAAGLPAQPASNQTWDNYWNNTLAPNAFELASSESPPGYTVFFIIHRMCGGLGAATNAGANCVPSPSQTSSAGASHGSGSPAYFTSSQIYYRVTTKVQGPRNTVSYVQSIVAM